MPAHNYTFGDDGAVTDFTLPNVVEAGASNVEWVMFNDTSKNLMITLNRTGSDVTATLREYSSHRDVVTNRALDVSADEVLEIPAGGSISGTVSNAGSAAEGFGLRTAVAGHGTGAVSGQQVRLLVQ